MIPRESLTTLPTRMKPGIAGLSFNYANFYGLPACLPLTDRSSLRINDDFSIPDAFIFPEDIRRSTLNLPSILHNNVTKIHARRIGACLEPPISVPWICSVFLKTPLRKTPPVNNSSISVATRFIYLDLRGAPHSTLKFRENRSEPVRTGAIPRSTAITAPETSWRSPLIKR